MDRLWTPWRRAFIEGTARTPSDACFLCTVPTQTDDRASYLLFRGERVFALLNLYPYNSGHLMVAPYSHTGELDNLEASTAQELMALVQRCVGVVKRVYQP